MREISPVRHWPVGQFSATIPEVELVAAATIWTMFGSFLVFPMLGLPAALHRSAMTLLSAELVALALHGYAGPALAAAGRSMATIDIPLLSAALLALVIMRAREDSRHWVARQGGGRDGQRTRGRRARRHRV
jgi:hypothetical protein